MGEIIVPSGGYNASYRFLGSNSSSTVTGKPVYIIISRTTSNGKPSLKVNNYTWYPIYDNNGTAVGGMYTYIYLLENANNTSITWTGIATAIEIN